jgi:hypothetical protein
MVDGVAVVTNFARMTDEAFRQSVEQDFGFTPSVYGAVPLTPRWGEEASGKRRQLAA